MATVDLAEELGTVLARLSAVLRRAILPVGMNPAQARTLATLRDGPRRVTELARMENLRQPTMSVVLARMERRGWVARGEVDGDRRAVAVTLTFAGRAVVDQLVAARTSLLRSYLDEMTPADHDAVAASLPALEGLVAAAQRPRRGGTATDARSLGARDAGPSGVSGAALGRPA